MARRDLSMGGSSVYNVAFGALTLVAFLLLATCHSGPAIFPRSSEEEFRVYSKVLSPRREVVNGTEFVYQVPPGRPRAALVLFHGCNCKATFFWDAHSGCATCSGAPEERAFVAKALRRSYAVIAVSSGGSCWRKDDTQRVKLVLESWVDRFRLVELPLLGLGASSGGYFLSGFARVVKFDAVVLMIAEGRFRFPPEPTYPPVLFVHMVKDATRAERIRKTIPALRNAGIDADEIQCKEVNITEGFFATRIPYVDLVMSVQLRAALVQSGCLDSSGLLKLDGRALQLKRVMSPELVESLSALSDHWEHHIREQLNVAFAFHEFTSQPSGKIFTWWESHVSMPPNVTSS